MASPSSSEASTDAFGLLGLPRRFDLDVAQLERAFFELSKEAHPDRFATAPPSERVAALSKARALNDAYQVLRRETSRAEYLLEREGIVIGDNERLDPELVMGLLEEREVLAEARQAGELARIEALQSSMQMRRRTALDRVRLLFVEDGDRAEIKKQLILLRYVDRYLEECESALEQD